MLNKNLRISTITRNLRSICRSSTILNPKLEPSRVFSCSFHHDRESRVSRSYINKFPANYTLSIRHFCSSDGSLDKCWNCGSISVSKPFLACESCKSVQPVSSSVNYFQIFGLETIFDIEETNLERIYKDWQKKLHPDLVHTKSEKEKEYAAEQSARVVDAYRTLRKPLSRAIYLLRLEGVHVDEERTVSDPELLAEIMEIREAVEDADNSEILKQIQVQVLEKLETWSKSFGNALRDKKFEDAVTSIQRMTYYDRINEEIIKKF